MKVAILGAGVSGICMAIKLKKSGIEEFTIFEKSSNLGGTWFDNTYPGCACDVPSHFYSYSFELKTDWTRVYSSSEEIRQYLEFCAEKYQIVSNIKFNTEINSASFLSKKNVWELKTSKGKKIETKFLISGLGQLNSPNVPDIRGIDTFKGESFHSSRWNHDYNLENKEIAVIGNGGSAVQFIPELGKKAKKLYIFQKSAHWAMERRDKPYSEFTKWLFKYFPLVLRLYRFRTWVLLGSNYYALVKQTWYTKFLEGKTLQYLNSIVKDLDLVKKLTPSYPFGCKRVLVVENYYETLVKENCEVVDSPILEIKKDSIVDSERNERKVDLIIYATGFRTSEFLTPLEVFGFEGKRLKDSWSKGAEAHRGIAVSGFPNFFMLYGPNTNLGHNSIIFMIECQSEYILKCIKKTLRNNSSYIDVKEDEMTKYNQRVQKGLAETVFSANCDSWYKNEKGKVINNYHKGHINYWLENTNPKFKEFNFD